MLKPGAPLPAAQQSQALLDQHEFLLRLSDAMRPLADAGAVVGEACRLLGEHLEVNRAYYVEIDETAGLASVAQDWVLGNTPSLVGEHRVADFGWSVAILRRGECLVISDTQTSEQVPPEERPASAALGIIACMGTPLIKDGQLVGALCVTNEHPREWAERDVELLREVGERIWDAIRRVRAEHALRASEARYRTLFNSIDEGFCTIDVLFNAQGQAVDYRFLDMNPAFVRQTGLETALGRTIRDLAPHHEAFWFEVYGQIACTGKARRFEHEAAALGRFYDVFAFKIGGPEERQVAVIFQDITKRRRAEATIQEMNRTLEQRVEERTHALAAERAALQVLNEELEAFTYSVSHDLRTPVRHIVSFGDLLQASLSGPLDPKAERYLGIIRNAAVTLNTLIDGMLDISRSSRQPLKREQVELDRVFQTVRQKMSVDQPQRQIDWQVSALPTVSGDAELLRRVITALVDNAVKYTRGQEPAVITVWAEDRGDRWAVFVRDNGVGFNPQYVSKLFTMFQRLHRQEDFEGAAVSLANARRIVARHGGTMTAEGLPGEGATFGFILSKTSG